jgi:hypothetical protein
MLGDQRPEPTESELIEAYFHGARGRDHGTRRAIHDMIVTLAEMASGQVIHGSDAPKERPGGVQEIDWVLSCVKLPEPARRFRGYRPLAAVQPRGRILVSGSRIIEKQPGGLPLGPGPVRFDNLVARGCSALLFRSNLPSITAADRLHHHIRM